ncbi:MAG: hypothetical protein LBM13_06305 [Candidatus Ancillula sp.]|jgi:hypothetical protein|nr:hypothetical protein [Candidatus Ancillula sp.]
MTDKVELENIVLKKIENGNIAITGKIKNGTDKDLIGFNLQGIAKNEKGNPVKIFGKTKFTLAISDVRIPAHSESDLDEIDLNKENVRSIDVDIVDPIFDEAAQILATSSISKSEFQKVKNNSEINSNSGTDLVNATSENIVVQTPGTDIVPNQNGQVAVQNVPRTPMSKKKVHLIVGIIIAIVVLIVALISAYFILDKAVWNPKNAVTEYVNALNDGDYNKALSLSDPNIQKQVTDFTKSISLDKGAEFLGITVEQKSVNKNNAVLTFIGKIDGVTESFDVNLVAKSKFLIFKDWQLQEGVGQYVKFNSPSGVNSLLLNGTKIPAAMDEFYLFPGKYVVSMEKSKYYTMDDKKFTVTANSNEWTIESSDVKLNETVAENAAKIHLTDFMNYCASVKSAITPDGCPFSSTSDYSDSDYSNFYWTINRQPNAEVNISDNGIALTFDQGLAVLHYTYTSDSWFGDNTYSYDETSDYTISSDTSTSDGDFEIKISNNMMQIWHDGIDITTLHGQAPADSNQKKTTVYVTNESNSDICIRTSPNAPAGTCKEENVGDSDYNILLYIKAGDTSVKLTSANESQTVDGSTWIKVTDAAHEVGWVRSDLVKAE